MKNIGSFQFSCLRQLQAIWKGSFLAIALWPLTACGGPADTQTDQSPPEEDTARLELLGQGEAMAENLCAPCHAIGRTDTSPHPEALPLRNLSKKYPVQALAGPLSEGIIVGHPDMPEWQFEPQHVEALLAYLESIQAPQET